MDEAKRCIFFAGAPRVESLKWDEATLLSSFVTRVQTFLGGPISNHTSTKLTPPASFAKWRSIPFNEAASKLSFVHDGVPVHGSRNPAKQTQHGTHLDDSDFLEHSIAVLDDLDSYQIIPTVPEPVEEDTTLQTMTTSFGTSLTDTSIQTSNISFESTIGAPIMKDSAVPKLRGGITDLKQLPSASHIAHIKPQTKTVNLTAGVISIAQPRIIRLKRARRNINEMEIIELLVGDETRAGFSISFWLVPVESQGKRSDDSELRGMLAGLRAGMVMLVQNVALECWKGSVFGQSLSGRRFGRSGTVLTVLDDECESGLGMQAEKKLERVRGWTRNFVGVGRRAYDSGRLSKDKRGGKKRKIDELPPDTQD